MNASARTSTETAENYTVHDAEYTRKFQAAKELARYSGCHKSGALGVVVTVSVVNLRHIQKKGDPSEQAELAKLSFKDAGRGHNVINGNKVSNGHGSGNGQIKLCIDGFGTIMCRKYVHCADREDLPPLSRRRSSPCTATRHDATGTGKKAESVIATRDVAKAVHWFDEL